ERPGGEGVGALFDSRGAQDLGPGREVVGQALDDDAVATEGKVGTVLLAGAHRDEEAGITLEYEAHFVGSEGLEVQRRAHVVLGGCAAAAGAAEWLHGNAAAWAWAAGAAGGVAAAPGLGRKVPPARTAGAATPRLALRHAPGTGRPHVRTPRLVLPARRAGRHRFVPARDTAELRAVITPFYVALEARRQTRGGGTAVGTVLLDAAPAAPDRGRAVSARFEQAHGVALRFYAPRLAPHDPDVFDYCPTSCERGDTLFSVEPVAPAQGDAKLAVWRAAALRAAVALGVTLILLLVAAPAGAWRWLVVLVAAWCAASAPLGLPGRAAELFSPAVFYRSALGAFSASAGSLAVLGVVALLAASALWRRGLERRWWHVTGAALLVLAAPYLVRYLGRGIAPPAGGAGFALWMAWEAAVAGAAMALILGAAALVRGPAEPARVPWALPVACVWAALAGLAGLWLWN